jgi:phage terminase large subunit-like protein
VQEAAVPLRLAPDQLAAVQVRGRELLLAAEPRAGASYMLRVLALLHAASEPGATVVLAVPDHAKVRPTHLEGKGGLWELLAGPRAAGAVKILPGALVRFANGSSLQVVDWQTAARRGASMLLVDDADELGWASYSALREAVLLQAPAAADASPRLVVAARRPDEGWVREHWHQLRPPAGATARLRAEALPAELRGQAPPVASKLLLRDFIRRVRPAFDWRYASSMMVEVLEAVLTAEITRLLIFAPPRVGKSEIVSRLLPGCKLRRDPHEWFGLGSAGGRLANELSKDARTVFRESGGVFREDSNDATLWRTEAGGGMWARGVGAAILGHGFNLGVVDDPFGSRLLACRVTEQERVLKWFWDDFYSRRQLGGSQRSCVVVMHQRLDEGDLAGRLLQAELEGKSPEQWHILNLPAIKRRREFAFPPSCKVIEDPRPDGSLLWPEGLDEVELRHLEERDVFSFSALYMQEPKPSKGGGVFQRSYFTEFGGEEVLELVRQLRGQGLALNELIAELQRLGKLPAFTNEVRAWDIAATADGGDSTAGVRGGSWSESVVVSPSSKRAISVRRVCWVDAVDRKVGPGLVQRLIVETAEQDGKSVKVVLPADPGAGAKIAIEAIQRELKARQFQVEVVPISGSKVLRARPHAGAAAPLHEGAPGRVYVLPGDWVDRFVEQHHRFDGLEGHADDLVDAASDAFGQLAVQVAREHLGWGMPATGEPEE